MIHYTCPMLFPALSLPFLIGGRDGTTPVFTVVSIHPHKVLLQHLQQSMWPFCGLIPLPHWSTTIHSSPPTTNCHLTGRRSSWWVVSWQTHLPWCLVGWYLSHKGKGEKLLPGPWRLTRRRAIQRGVRRTTFRMALSCSCVPFGGRWC